MVYTDADMWVTNSSKQIAEWEDAATAATAAKDGSIPLFIAQDGGDEINSGFFMVRSTRQGLSVLREWLLAAWQLRHHTLMEQVALSAALLWREQDAVARSMGVVGAGSIPPFHRCLDAQFKTNHNFCGCWDTQMSALGLPIGERSWQGIHLLNSTPGQRANMIVTTGRHGVKWRRMHPMQVWREGDALGHIITFFGQHLLLQAAFGREYAVIEGGAGLCPEAWALAPACAQPPCQHNLWRQDPSTGAFEYLQWSWWEPAVYSLPPALASVPASCDTSGACVVQLHGGAPLTCRVIAAMGWLLTPAAWNAASEHHGCHVIHDWNQAPAVARLGAAPCIGCTARWWQRIRTNAAQDIPPWTVHCIPLVFAVQARGVQWKERYVAIHTAVQGQEDGMRVALASRVTDAVVYAAEYQDGNWPTQESARGRWREGGGALPCLQSAVQHRANVRARALSAEL